MYEMSKYNQKLCHIWSQFVLTHRFLKPTFGWFPLGKFSGFFLRIFTPPPPPKKKSRYCDPQRLVTHHNFTIFKLSLKGSPFLTTKNETSCDCRHDLSKIQIPFVVDASDSGPSKSHAKLAASCTQKDRFLYMILDDSWWCYGPGRDFFLGFPGIRFCDQIPSGYPPKMALTNQKTPRWNPDRWSTKIPIRLEDPMKNEGWEPKKDPIESKNHLNQTSMFGVHNVNFP